MAGSRDGMLTSAHDLSDGGLAQAVVESCLRGGTTGSLGARLVLAAGEDPFVALFSESSARALVSVPRTEEMRFTDMCSVRGLPWTRIGVVDGLGDGASLEIQDVLSVTLGELREAHEGTLPSLFGSSEALAVGAGGDPAPGVAVDGRR